MESYGLRLRHLIMGCYFPKREKQRAAWLYNHIVKCRGGIIQSARKRMRGVKFGDVDVQHISWRGQMAARYELSNIRLVTKYPVCFKFELHKSLTVQNSNYIYGPFRTLEFNLVCFEYLMYFFYPMLLEPELSSISFILTQLSRI